jgi:DNA-binding SARP family transcriptional activator
LTKCYELLGFLAVRFGASASRDELLDALFDAGNDESARSYLRKTVIGVRRVLPPEAISVLADGRVTLGREIVLATESVRLEQQLASAARLQGEYLPGIGSAWVDERRNRLTELATTARAAAADAAYAADQYPRAQRLAAAVLAADPLREGTWRTLMRIHSAVGDYDCVITAYAQREKALRAAGISPASSTRTLLDRLRR